MDEAQIALGPKPGERSDEDLRKAAYALAAVGMAMAEVGIKASLSDAQKFVKELERNGYAITKKEDKP